MHQYHATAHGCLDMSPYVFGLVLFPYNEC
jgi:hypothetical protein